MDPMTAGLDDTTARAEIDRRIRQLIPEDYQETYQDLQPVSMRSAGLVFGSDGRVAWDRIWGSFCDLAMAGGPPHKGRLLEPGTAADIAAHHERYDEVIEEICRGVWMAAALEAHPSPVAGWVRVKCFGPAMAGWLLRAIVMENVAVRVEGASIDLPAAPGFTLEKEIKNVVTVIAKTCHYWMGHMPAAQHHAIAALFDELATTSPVIVPGATDDPAVPALTRAVGDTLQRHTGLAPTYGHAIGWLGLECDSVGAAIWLMRALVVSNVLARREGITLLVPIAPGLDPDGARVIDAVIRVHTLSNARR